MIDILRQEQVLKRALFFNKIRRTMEEEKINNNNTLYLQDLKFAIFADMFLILVTTLKNSVLSTSQVKKQIEGFAFIF